ncbi:undecaprenyl-phosphate glucose phosphotransferase [Pseudoflavonifractor phocaeensis]|uniref:undecaprenyl-phosphate glucose phosphotransferase n=1 Tax=Pseudoflavonifractor phocaeensis TaxID=1870988 RepID=UPI00195A9859|nr:undecaprenyl-phosphate glucose phosphotransferase [Pseudoflavonifractor phocaeensis]MBM6721500.1 undecaprenyl-phosphate glucose phosphotransferase [Pseudoflavonifractor phocaeensis]
MIKENQRTLNTINVLLDALILWVAMPVAFYIRFYLLHDGIITVPLSGYMLLLLFLIPSHLITFATLGLYESLRKRTIGWELTQVFWGCVINFILAQTGLFLYKEVHFSRGTLIIFFVLSFFMMCAKRSCLRALLRHFRQQGFNQKHVLLVGDSHMALRYVQVVSRQREYGYLIDGYLSEHDSIPGLTYLGSVKALEKVLERRRPDEVVVALPAEEFRFTREVIEACEKDGIKLSMIPFYAEYIPSNPQFDNIEGIPLMNIRHIPLDNWVNAAVKRTLDIVGSLVLIICTSPIMLIAVIGVRLSSPGPVIFKQERVGRNKKPFMMYKFRSMRVNAAQDTGWSRNSDPRKTKFGAILRKFSIDELPQFFNVLKGDMSLVGPRPEVPHYVQQFKEEIPLYMVKHQVRPGITGWAQVNGLRGDTSIEERIRYDIYYIENWNFFFDLKILFMTLVKGVVNQEKL